MKKAILFIFLLSVCLEVGAQGRFVNMFEESCYRDLVEKSLYNNAIIFRQGYELEDSKGKTFGINNRKEFEISYNLAVKYNGGVIVSNRALNPWLYSNSYAKYKDDYKPKPFPSQYSELGDSLAYVEFGLKDTARISIFQGLALAIRSSQFEGNGIDVYKQTGTTDCWVFWYIQNKREDLEKSANFSIKSTRVSLNIGESDNALYDLQRVITQDSIMGGYVVTPVSNRIGSIEFQLVGVLQYYNHGWKALCPFHNVAIDVKPEDNEMEDDVILTPNKSNKKR